MTQPNYTERIKVKRDDTALLFATLSDADGAVDLTGAAVVFATRAHSDGAEASSTPTIVSAAAGRVSFVVPTAEDAYDAEFQVTFTDESVQTFPSDGYILVEVVEDIA